MRKSLVVLCLAALGLFGPFGRLHNPWHHQPPPTLCGLDVTARGPALLACPYQPIRRPLPNSPGFGYGEEPGDGTIGPI